MYHRTFSKCISCAVFSQSQLQGIDLIMRYFVGTEIGVANLLQRQYDWSSNALWYEEIPNARDYNKTFFVLGGNDVIVKAQVQGFLVRFLD